MVSEYGRSPWWGLGAAVVDTNIPPAYFDFPPAQGIVTIEVWLKPHPGRDANMMFGVGNRDPRRTLNEDGRYDGTLLWKNDEGVWYHKAAYHPSVPTEASGANVPFDHYDGKWTRFTVVYNTAANVYDAYMGDEMLFANMPVPYDYSAGISYVMVSSGRWGYDVDQPSYLDELRISVAPIPTHVD